MKKKLSILLMTAVFSLLFAMTALAGQWKQDAKGWWWDNGNGTYPKSAWQWCDGNNDGTAECYYFDGNGYCLMNTTTPDGYTVNKDGAWIVNGAIQTKNTGAVAAVTNAASSSSKGVVFNGHYYGTPTGKCYHYSAACAGKNATEITAEQAAKLKPCGTCVE